MNDNIFISSTCYDLIDLRAELKEYVKSIGLNPIMSDAPDTDFITPNDKNSIETCLVNLRRCDTVILILSQRYGPSLKKAGFTDHSATHLEYNEAVNRNIKIILFVRDRLLADYEAYNESKDEKALQWIDKKDMRLFELIDRHKKLVNNEKDNWYWSFSNSLDVKRRLKIDLKAQMDTVRLNRLIESGRIPFMTATCKASNVINGPKLKTLDFTITNVGTLTAIEPHAFLCKAQNYKQVMDELQLWEAGGYHHSVIKPLKPDESQPQIIFQVTISDAEVLSKTAKFVLVIMYRTIQGDLFFDASELTLNWQIHDEKISAGCSHTVKHHITTETYHKLSGNII